MTQQPMHKKEQCEGGICTFHNPSNHHMKDWPITVRYDRYGLAERKCSHGCGHPDPDSVTWLKELYDSGVFFRMGVLDVPDPKYAEKPDFDPYSIFTLHGCDFCCSSTSAKDENSDTLLIAPTTVTEQN